MAVIIVVVFVVIKCSGSAASGGASSGSIASTSAAKFGSRPETESDDGSYRFWPNLAKSNSASKYSFSKSPPIYGKLSGRKSKFLFINFKRDEM